MLIVINALKSIVRSKGRNILIGVIVLTIAVASCVALSIRNAAREAEESGMEQLSVTATISPDRSGMMTSAWGDRGNREQSSSSTNISDMLRQFSGLEIDELQKYAQSQYVEDFYYSSSVSLSASGELEPVTSDDTQSSGGGGGFVISGGMGGSMSMSMGDFTITGYSSESAMTGFINGTSKVIEGTVFDIDSDELNCLISYELALFNDLEVGDKITLANPNNEEETYTFTIAGIYINSESSSSDYAVRFSAAMDPANAIYISYPALKAIIDYSEENATTQTVEGTDYERSSAFTNSVNGVYVFSDVDDYEAFVEDVKTMGLSENYVVSSSDIDSYESSLVPLKNLSSFALTLLLVVLLVGGIILVVLNVFNIRERKYEVGVLTAIGIKKGKVAMQFITELLTVTLVAIFIGAIIGAVASVPISNNLLESQVSSLEQQQSNRDQNFGRPSNMQGQGGVMISGPGMSMSNQNVDYLDKINATINVSVLFQLMGIGVLLTIISSLAAVVFILRYEPLKILSNRA